MNSSRLSVSIVGAGVIGLSCAWALSRRGAQVTLYDKSEPGRGASWAAAGMLAPAYEGACEDGAHPGLFDLCLEGAALWRSFATELEEASGQPIGYAPGPSLAVTTEAEGADRLRHMSQILDVADAPWEALSQQQARDLEPALTAPLSGALLLPTDGHVDNRALCKALIIACRDAGVRFNIGRSVQRHDDLGGETVLWTTGAAPLLSGVHPVKGAAFCAPPSSATPKRAVRCGSLYFTPHTDRVVIGATVEPGKHDLDPEPAQILQLHAAAAALCAGVQDISPNASWAGVRPGTRDHAPMLGQLTSGDWVAAGHYRNGILLAPLTGEIMANMILGEPGETRASRFSPDRFASIA